ncbi:hypothetical protein LZ017_14670 [Pelomonas sp. CA6]|uniref:hypothetical protein n=1 Tax=Pelomonas sp. CA6 TaxID=2907999 RepID=UPI001F4C2E1E|nr:hypothetical protein [Pelomonas sp. CA6]MCH7344622.1 hypothetical protein [Pelomonas sp. CA6]
MAAALYLAGGADHSALLLATAGERLLGEVARLAQSAADEELEAMMANLPHYEPAPVEVAGHARNRQLQSAMSLSGSSAPDTTAVRQNTAALLRAAWYTLESTGLESLGPPRLQDAIERSTIYADLTG